MMNAHICLIMKKIVFIVFILVVLTGCNKTPPTTIDNGIVRGQSINERKISDIMYSGNEPETTIPSETDKPVHNNEETSEYIAQSEQALETTVEQETSSNSETEDQKQDTKVVASNESINYQHTNITKTLSNSENTVYVNADVNYPAQYTGYSIYNAVLTDYSTYKNNMKSLFGSYETYAVTDDFGRIIVNIEGEYEASIGYLEMGRGIAFSKVIMSGSASTALSDSEAKSQADSILNSIGVEGFSYSSINTGSDQMAGEIIPEEKQVIYNQLLDGVPVKSFIYNSNNQDEYIFDATMAMVTLDSVGVCNVRVIQYDFNKKEDIDKCLNLDEALAVLQNSLSNTNLNIYTPITEIDFEYSLQFGNNGEITAVPCWRFCVDVSQLATMSDGGNYYCNDIVMNAVTGNLTYIVNRY